MAGREQNFYSEYENKLPECIKLTESELSDRKRGIPGDGNQEQLEELLEILKKYQTNLRAGNFPPRENRRVYFEPLESIARWVDDANPSDLYIEVYMLSALYRRLIVPSLV